MGRDGVGRGVKTSAPPNLAGMGKTVLLGAIVLTRGVYSGTAVIARRTVHLALSRMHAPHRLFDIRDEVVNNSSLPAVIRSCCSHNCQI